MVSSPLKKSKILKMETYWERIRREREIEYPYVCPDCKETFRLKQTLVQHTCSAENHNPNLKGSNRGE